MKEKQNESFETSQKDNTVPVRKSTLILLFCLCGVLAAGTGVGIYRSYRSQDTYRELDQLAKTVKQNYYTDVDENDVMQGAMKGYVAGLDDPYSQYMTDEEYSAYQTDEAGQTIGIGVTVQQNEDGYLQVVSVSDDSPAKDAGIQAADVILKVGEDDVAELGYAGAVAEVRGEAGTTVTLTIQRGDQTKELEVERRSMDVTTAQGKMLDGNIGYIRISAFKGNTPEQFQAIFDQLVQDGAKALVFDLRDDGGGLVDVTCNILDELLPEGLIVYTEDKYGNRQEEYSDAEHYFDGKMAVLVNGNSASASEIFAGAIKDYGVGTLIGTQTFGKGIVQSLFPLSDGSAIEITVSRYYTPAGNNIHEVGIAPDIVLDKDTESADDNQLQKAIEVLSE